ncbi:hypothetical protein A4X13_0g879 [Tilletia indica]|uniref:Uncharacterized protein n=1 Tax=Tilletia indica TaxID=43049 RepID=A0A177TFZ1_9BASI|nr:hypothetical protein A4X13_0g879 [Tilletia indica]
MEDYGIPSIRSSSPIQAFSSSGQVPFPTRSNGTRLATSARADTASSSRTDSARTAASRSGGSSLLDALNSSYSASQSKPIASQIEEEPPSKRRRKEAAEQQKQQAALKMAKKTEERNSKEAEKNRKKAEKATIMATKKDWTDANKLKRSKTETFSEMVVDIDGALTAPAAAPPSTNTTTGGPTHLSFAGALLGSGITALQARLHEEGATTNIVGSAEPRGASATNPLSTALGIATPLPDLPVIRLRRKIKARLDVEHRIWVPLPAPTMQHEPTAIIVLSAPEILAHLARGPGSLAQMIPRVKANLASGGGVHQSQAFQLFFVVIGLQIHFRKVAQKNDQDWRKAVQTGLARRTEDDAGSVVETGPSAASSSRKRKGQVAETFPQVDQEQAELELLRLTMEHGVYVIHAKALVDAVEAVVDIVGEVGIRPYKMVANSHLPFCTDAIRTRTAGTDEDMYLNMLQQIPRVTEPAARAIQAEYPTMRSLMEAYDSALEADRHRKGSKSKIDDLLAECVIRNRVDGKASSRRVGPAMSKRVGFVLTHDDPLALV